MWWLGIGALGAVAALLPLARTWARVNELLDEHHGADEHWADELHHVGEALHAEGPRGLSGLRGGS